MNYHFCGADFGCWTDWLFTSNAGAAWVQALVAILAILFANKRAREAFKNAREEDLERERKKAQREREREHLQQGKALARVKVAMLNIATAAETALRVRAENDGFFVQAQLEEALSEILEGKELLRSLMFHDLPDPKIVAYINSAASTASDFTSFCRYAMERGEVGEGLADIMREFAEDMTGRHDVLQAFHESFSVNPNAEFTWRRDRGESPAGATSEAGKNR